MTVILLHVIDRCLLIKPPVSSKERLSTTCQCPCSLSNRLIIRCDKDTVVEPVIATVVVGTEVDSVVTSIGDRIVISHSIGIPCLGLAKDLHHLELTTSGHVGSKGVLLALSLAVESHLVIRIDSPVGHATDNVVFRRWFGSLIQRHIGSDISRFHLCTEVVGSEVGVLQRDGAGSETIGSLYLQGDSVARSNQSTTH